MTETYLTYVEGIMNRSTSRSRFSEVPQTDEKNEPKAHPTTSSDLQSQCTTTSSVS